MQEYWSGGIATLIVCVLKVAYPSVCLEVW